MHTKKKNTHSNEHLSFKLYIYIYTLFKAKKGKRDIKSFVYVFKKVSF
jgi:hypothetical protein